MISRLVFLAVLACGCFGDVPVVETSGPAGTAIVPPIPVEPTDELASYRWEVVESVDGSFVGGTKVDTPRTELRFDRRGLYVIDRWIRSGLSERLTHHIIVTVTGTPPIARITGATFVAVGTATHLDATLSESLEDRSLSYRWQLITRPATSQATLPPSEIEASTVTLVPDTPGTYGVQLRVFDGELWSDAVISTLEAHD